MTRWRDAIRAPSGAKARIRGALRGAAISTLALASGRGASTFLRGVYCHYVFDDQRDAFETVISSLQQVGTFVDTPTCLAMLEGRRPVDGRYFHLSFDDGFRNIVTNAVPILSRLRVPAIFFVPTAFIDSDLETARHYSVDIAEYAAPIEMARWDDLRVMAAGGVEVGSHTRTHARLSDISGDAERLEQELAGSRRDIEQRLGVPCRYFAWPFGKLSDVDETSLAAVKRSGYEACFGAFRGSVSPGRTDRFRIPRHGFEAQWPLSHVRYFASGHMEASAGAA